MSLSAKAHGYWYCDKCEENAHSPRCQKCHGTASFKEVAPEIIPAPQPAWTPPVEEVEPAKPAPAAEPKISGAEWIRRMRAVVAQAPDTL